jgi:hypothetical protein
VPISCVSINAIGKSTASIFPQTLISSNRTALSGSLPEKKSNGDVLHAAHSSVCTSRNAFSAATNGAHKR